MPIVRAGSPFAKGLAPLLPTRSWTIAGRERFGGPRPTGGAGVQYGGRLPQGPIGFRGFVPTGAPFRPGLAPLLPTRSWTIAGRERFGGPSPTAGAGVRFGGRLQFPIPNVLPRRRGLSGAGGTLSLENVTTGNPASFQVGDQWRISINGALPNAPVYLATNFRNMTTPMSGQQDLALSAWMGRYMTGNEAYGLGMTDAAGNWSSSGIFNSSQTGHWVQRWTVQGNAAMTPAGIQGLDFTVADAAGVVTPDTPNVPVPGTPYYTLATNNVPTQPASTGYQTLAQQLGSNYYLPTGVLVPSTYVSPTAVTTQTQPVTGGNAGVLTFTNLTSGNTSQFRVGDSWRVTITGASPNQLVAVQGTQNGSTSSATIGQTDASGNFSVTGSMDASTVGQWSESWTVGGLPAGSLVFSVVQPAAATTSPTSYTTTSPLPAGASPVPSATAPAGTFDVGTFLTGSAVSGIPNWALAAAAGVLLLLVVKK